MLDLIQSVSFYGDSFVELKIAESSFLTSLQLRFRTSKPHGLLFLAAGKKDYCLVELHSGHVQLRINLGAGEQVLHSQSGFQLNDLFWHLVELHHKKDNIILIIDQHYRSNAKMAETLYELNDEHKIYIGGSGSLDVPYLDSAMTNFRGCIDGVLFNQKEILTSLRPYNSLKNVHEVSLGCSDEFFAGEEEPISFFSSKSYVSFPLWDIQQEGVFEYALQTSAQRGLLLYNSGQKGDFIAMEIEDGLIKAYIGKNKSRTQLYSLKSISENKWHFIELKFTAEYLQLTIDEETVKTSLASHSKLPLLKGPLFIGGIDDSTRAEVMKLELTSVSGKYARGGSFQEGEGELITKTQLLVQMLDNKVFQYKVTKSPQHGKLKLINLSDSLESNDNITIFTNHDIINERLIYVHDDSETMFDEFLAVASIKESGTSVNSDSDTEHLSVEIRFNISVALKNDEKPVRVVDKVFHVVNNGQRLLTLADLCYHDPDSDFDDGQLLYTRRGIPNGDLVLVNDTTYRLYQFKQEDLEQKQVLFRHRGASYGRFVLFVTDGKHYTSSLLEVSASDPYLRLANNTGLLVQKGKEKTITIANLSVITNQDIRSDQEITYKIFSPPKYGRIYVNNLAMDSFTQLDLKRGCVIYRHDDSNNLVDTFNITVYANAIHLDVGLHVHVYLQSHQHAPRIVHNNNLLVEEGKPVKISKGKLQVVHENSSPSEIVFMRDIDDGNIQYVQTASDELRDHFSLDVTNSIQAISGIDIFVDIIPKLIPLEVQNFTVIEGGSKAVMEDYIKISNQHFTGLNCEFLIIEPPKHGYVENSHFPGIKLTKFNRKQVEQELIFYVHDGSENLIDNFTLIANNTEPWKQSLPQTIFVTVTPVNDEGPVISKNKILRVWVASVTEITVDDLCAEDKDSLPSELVYSVTPPSNGHLALKSSPNKSILNFTQAHITEGQLVFVHNGPMSGGFNFQVTDGLNFAPRQIFSITAQTLLISLEINKGLRIFPGSKKPISAHDLKAVTNDVANTGNRTITFTVVHSPKLGRLIKTDSSNTTQDIFSFTQSMVDEGLVVYEHTQIEALGWNGEDSFTFTVSSPPATLDLQVFHIAISYDINRHDHNSHLLANTGAVVQEGGKVIINKMNLDASNLLVKLPEMERSMYEVWYQVISLPQHGIVVVGERNITKEKPNFSQYILNKFGITYVHDNSESFTDHFTFAVWLNLKSKTATKPDTDILEEMFNITVVPVNDQAPELKTKRLHLKFLQGDTFVVGPENLKVEDLDNTPGEIKYTIISNPSNGFLAMTDNLTVPVQDFTQADIDSGRVWFVHDGSSSSGVFYFSVTDGKHRPLYKLFNLEVTPVSLVIVNLTDVVLPQGQTSVTITYVQLSATTNGKNTNISYEVTEPLNYGHLMIGKSYYLEE
ncbi:hypothetical protein Y1Q_0009901 [Alligator mississippiensis]|uniref:Laminin G domain-containing protein n=1 Tax=Alligator mississippiensis TaxID=8496 RepID=A0A151MX67_ALLMI|nr:hypothetical protein Y1Q_0009901 [Alligator mississippiensis]